MKFSPNQQNAYQICRPFFCYLNLVWIWLVSILCDLVTTCPKKTRTRMGCEQTLLYCHNIWNTCVSAAEYQLKSCGHVHFDRTDRECQAHEIIGHNKKNAQSCFVNNCVSYMYAESKMRIVFLLLFFSAFWWSREPMCPTAREGEREICVHKPNSENRVL